MLVLACPPRALSASILYRSVSRRVIHRIRTVCSAIAAWTRSPSRLPGDSRVHTREVSDRDEVALTAHDCLTLLAIMVRCADAMRHPEAEDDFREFQRAADRMDRLAHQLIAPRQTEVERLEPIDLNQVIAESEGMLKRAVAPGVSLRLQPGILRGARIRARRWDVERILLHLVINAVRGMAPAGVVIETLAHAGVRPAVSLVVSGSAAAPTSPARISARASASGQHESDLGLAAVARLVQRLNGVLQFESDSERRTRIQVDFPLAVDDLPDNPA
jgi:signal transduction histidine kinase